MQVTSAGPVAVITIDRPAVRNAVDRATADALSQAFSKFEDDPGMLVAVLTGSGGTFCAGADLTAISSGGGNRVDLDATLDGPMGPTRMNLSKPVIAAIEGFAVAGGLELAVWCDLRVMAEDATFGVYCRRWGVPLVDGGTVRLPRLVGHGRAMDLILTGRAVGAAEALAIGLADRVVPSGSARPAAIALATEIASLPQTCMRSDRSSVIEQWSLEHTAAMVNETRRGLEVIASGETLSGAARFATGAGRHGQPAQRR